MKQLNKIYLHEYFLKDGLQGFKEDVSTCLTEKFDTSRSHKRQYYWMRTYKAATPFGLNIEEKYRAVILLRIYLPI